MFKPGDSVFCIEAPWHDINSDHACGIKFFGPHVDEPVTIDLLLEDETRQLYLRLKEYPDVPNNPERLAGFKATFFRSIDDINIETNLLIPHDKENQ